MCEKIKTSFKKYFKKYWGYLVAFFGGAVSFIFFDRRRNSKLESDIEKLRDKLQEYEGLLEQARSENQLAGKQLSDAVAELGRAREQEQIIRQRFEANAGTVEEIGKLNSDIAGTTESLGAGIDQLRKFIQEKSKRD